MSKFFIHITFLGKWILLKRELCGFYFMPEEDKGGKPQEQRDVIEKRTQLKQKIAKRIQEVTEF
jgi:hypothetical protein